MSAALLRRCLPYIREAAAQEAHYGTPMSEDPREFHPDVECSTEEERALHQTLCDAWDRGERPEIPPAHQLLRGEDGQVIGRMSMQPLGLGTTTFRNPKAERLLKDMLSELGTAGKSRKAGAR